MAEGLCPSCKNSIWCPTWAEWKCKAKSRRVHSAVTKCDDYNKRGKDFKESKCQCKDCLRNEILWNEEEE